MEKPAAPSPREASTIQTPARVAHDMLQRATKGALATARAADGHPYVSMVLIAAGAAFKPIFMLSRLALHTHNLLVSPVCSLLIDETDAAGDPAAGSRLTLVGSTHPAADTDFASAFLARHPSARNYATFGDFGVYAMDVDSAHLIQGFGRISAIEHAALFAACA